MGAWGYGIFQSDATMDVADQIDDDFAKLANDAEMKLCCPEDHEKVAAKLNEGVLDQLFKDYSEIGWDYGLFYLGILSMQLGADVSLEKITLLKDLTEKIKEYPLTKQQMEKGLREYKVGVPYDFESLGLIDTMSSTPVGSSHGVNVLEDWSINRYKPQQKSHGAHEDPHCKSADMMAPKP